MSDPITSSTSSSLGASYSQSVYYNGPTVENVSQKTKDDYDALLQDIERILRKNPASTADAEALNKDMQQLEGLLEGGVTPKMKAFIENLFACMEVAGAKPSQNQFTISPEIIPIVGLASFTVDGKTQSLVDALKTVSDPTYDPNATKCISDMLLDLSNQVFSDYQKTLSDLQDQVSISTSIINNAQVLQDTLNMATVPTASNYKNPPTCWDDIPPGLQEQMRKENPDFFSYSSFKGSIDVVDANGKAVSYKTLTTGTNYLDYISPELKATLPTYPFTVVNRNTGAVISSEQKNYSWDGLPDASKAAIMNEWTKGVSGTGKPADFNDVSKWIGNHKDKYTSWSNDYFSTEVKPIATPKPDAATATSNLLKTRDQLQKDLDQLDSYEDVDKSLGSPYLTTKAMLDDLALKFPTDKYPIGCTVTKGADGQPVVRSKEGVVTASGKSVSDDLSAYILSGNDTGTDVSSHIDRAVSANNSFSQTKTHELQAKDTTLQTMYSILSDLAKSINDAMQNIGRNI